jgi:hypothetical protein
MPFKYIDYVKAHKKIAPYTSRLIARALVEADGMVIADSIIAWIRR